MAQRTRASFKALVDALLPDSAGPGSITPATLRAALRDLADSAAFPEDGGAAPSPDPGDPTPPPTPAASDFSADFSADFGAA